MHSDEIVIILLAISGMTLIVVLLIAIGLPMRASVRKRREIERTKREIAAYVAEGSIDPDRGIELMKAANAGRAETSLFDVGTGRQPDA